MIDAVRSASRGETPLPSTPYVGLVPYREEDAPFFFGRDEERDVVDGNLHAGRLTILYGPSGVGKTSLLRAGVVHDLRERVRARASNGTHRAAFAVCVHSAWREEPLPAQRGACARRRGARGRPAGRVRSRGAAALDGARADAARRP